MIRAGALSLFLVSAPMLAQTVDLSLVQRITPGAIAQGQDVAIQHEIFSPAATPGSVTLYIEIPPTLRFVEVKRDEGWACGKITSSLGTNVSCYASVMDAGTTARIAVTVIGDVQGVHRVRASVGGATPDHLNYDPNLSNNYSRNTVRVGNQDGYERILLPVVFPPTPGAHGSIWATEIWSRNESDVSMILSRYNAQCHILCPPEPWIVPPRSSRSLLPFEPPSAQTGFLLYVPLPQRDEVSFSLRAFDSSREALNFGTEIPVVREFDFFRGRFVLPDIPIEPEARITLRIYDAASFSGDGVRVWIYPASGRSVVEQFDLELAPPSPSESARPFRPAQVQLHDLSGQFPSLRAFERIRIEIEPLPQIDLERPDHPRLLWGFVTLTNNETQRITTVTPQ